MKTKKVSRLLHGLTRRVRRIVRQFMVRPFMARSDDWLIALYASSLPVRVKNILYTPINLTRLLSALILNGMKVKVHRLNQGNNDSPKAVYIGEGPWQPFLAHLLQSDAPEKKEAEEIAWWRIPAKVKSLSLETDLIFIEVNKLLGKWVRKGSEFHTLPWIRQSLDLTGQWEDVRNRFRKNTKATDLRRVRKYEYTYETTTDDQAFEDFFHHMYLPYLSDRYHERAILEEIHHLKQHFDRGMLLIVKREEKPVSGMICRVNGETCFFIALGIKDGDFTLVKEGATAALYYFLIRWAHEHGYKRLDFGRSRAFLDDGVFRYKRKWGTKVIHDWWIHTEIAIHVSDWNSQVCEFLAKHPIICAERGQLKGMVLLEHPSLVRDAKLDKIKLKYDTPGLAGLVLKLPKRSMSQTNSLAAETLKGYELRQFVK